MTAFTHSNGPPFTQRSSHVWSLAGAQWLLIAAGIWTAAALAVAAWTQSQFSHPSVVLSLVLKTGIVSGAAWVAARAMPFPQRDYARTGFLWVALTLITDMFLTARFGHGWLTLLGTASRRSEVIQLLDLFLWLVLPMAFASRGSRGLSGARRSLRQSARVR